MVKSVSFFLNSCIDIVIWTLCKFLAHHVQKRTLSSMYYQFAASPSRLKLTSNLSSPAMLLVTWQMSLSLQMYRSLVSLYRQRIQLSVLVRADGERRCRRWWVQLTQLRPTRVLKLTWKLALEYTCSEQEFSSLQFSSVHVLWTNFKIRYDTE